MTRQESRQEHEQQTREALQAAIKLLTPEQVNIIYLLVRQLITK